MPAPHVVECPLCFTSMKLKSAPKPGMKVRCRDCGTAFSPGDDEPVAAIEDDEDDSPRVRSARRTSSSSQRSGSGSRRKKRGSAGFPPGLLWAVIGLVALVAVGGLIVVAWGPISQMLAQNMGPRIDVQTLDLPFRKVVLDVRVKDLLDSPHAPADAKTSDRISEANNSLQPFLGVTWNDITWLRFISNAPTMMSRMSGGSGIAIIRANRKLTRPSTTTFPAEDVPCYRLATGEGATAANGMILFFADHYTAVIGEEQAIRQALGQRKQQTPPTSMRSALPQEPTAVMHLQMEGSEIRMPLLQMRSQMQILQALGQNSGAPTANVDQALSTLERGLGPISFAMNLQSDVSWTIGIQPTAGVSTAELHSSLETIRQQMAQAVALMNNLPQGTVRSGELQKLQAAVNSSFQQSGDRVSMTVSMPTNEAGAAITSMLQAIPSFGQVTAVDSPTVAQVPIENSLGLSTQMETTIQEFRDSMQPSPNLVGLVYTFEGNYRDDTLLQQINNAWGHDAPRHMRGKGNVDGKSLMVLGPIDDFPRFVDLLQQFGTVTASSAESRIVVLQTDQSRLKPPDMEMQSPSDFIRDLAEPDLATYQPLVDKHGAEKVYAVRLAGLPYNDATLATPLVEALRDAGDYDIAISPPLKKARYLYIGPVTELKEIRDVLGLFGNVGWEYTTKVRGCQLDWNRKK